jgi:glutaredoxin-like protein
LGILPEEHKEHLRTELREKLQNPVKIVMFTQELECKFCAETRELVQELPQLSDKIVVEVLDFVKDANRANEYGVDKVPAIVVLGEKDYGLRFYGFPFGYEFQTLLGDIIAVSRRTTDLSEETKQRLKEVKAPVHIKVFVTLVCPHCPVAAGLAHKFAIESDFVTAEVIDSSEFPHLAMKYGVMGVPKVVLNEKIEFVGAFEEDLFLEHILLASVST